MTGDMTEEEYKKFLMPDERDWNSKAVLMRTAIENARKNDEKKRKFSSLSGYRKLKKNQLIQVVRKQSNKPYNEKLDN